MTGKIYKTVALAASVVAVAVPTAQAGTSTTPLRLADAAATPAKQAPAINRGWGYRGWGNRGWGYRWGRAERA